MLSFLRVNTAMVSLHNNRTLGLYVYMPRVYSFSFTFPRVSYLLCIVQFYRKCILLDILMGLLVIFSHPPINLSHF